MENVQMKNEFKDEISKVLGVSPVLLNSADLGTSAQRRLRNFWSSMAIVPPSEPISGKTFQDILENGFVKDKYANTLITNHLCLTESGLKRGLGLSKMGKIQQLIYKTPVIFGMTENEILNYFKEHTTKGKKESQTDFNANGVFRTPSVIECERLQGLPDGYTLVKGNSPTQAYKQLGNSFCSSHFIWLLKQNIDILTK